MGNLNGIIIHILEPGGWNMQYSTVQYSTVRFRTVKYSHSATITWSAVSRQILRLAGSGTLKISTQAYNIIWMKKIARKINYL